MQKEIEIKFIIQDKDQIRRKLKDLKANLVIAERLLRRKTFDDLDLVLQEGCYKWGRVRDEGFGKVTMNIKEIKNPGLKIDMVDEIEINTDNFDKACEFFTSTGWAETNYQESKREEWNYQDCQITIDTWPGVPSFIEIEGGSEDLVYSIGEELGFTKKDAILGSVDFVYEKILGIPESSLKEIMILTFENCDEIFKNYKR